MAPTSLNIGPLEMEVLGLLDGSEPLSVARVQERLAESGQDLAYTTVMTVLTRLHAKKLLRREKIGRQFWYTYSRGTERAREGVLSKVHKALFRSERLRPIMSLLESEENLDIAELEELQKLVDLKLKRLKESP